MIEPELHTGVCTACGDVWQEDEPPVVCPECASTGVLGFPPGTTPPDV